MFMNIVNQHNCQSSKDRKKKLSILVSNFEEQLKNGQLDNSSEETIRTWINELLDIFGWNVKNTTQILQEKVLDKSSQLLLGEIGSHNIRPDYTFVNGRVKLAFLDAKSLSVSVKDSANAAFQIRSYGWSIGANFSIVTNFREMAIYSCAVMPKHGEPANFSRAYYFTYDEYIENFNTINALLDRRNLIQGSVRCIVGTDEPIDEAFAEFLGQFRLDLVSQIIKDNPSIHKSPETLTLWAQIIIDRILFIRVCEARGLEEEGSLLEYKKFGFWNKFRDCSYLEFYDKYDGPIFGRKEDLHCLNIDNEVFEKLLSYLYFPSPYRFDVIPLKTLSDIYDRFLSYSVKIEGNEVKSVLKDEYRKSKGAVTTPIRLVQKVLNQTIDRDKLERLSIEDILHLHFVDIACGSGVFLVGIFELLCEILLAKISKGEIAPKDFVVKSDYGYQLTVSAKRCIMQNCIFGVDIDEEATEVSKMSLALKVIDDYDLSDFDAVGIHGHQILNGVGNNIKCGNSLVSSDVLSIYPDIVKNVEELKQTRAFDWNVVFKPIFEDFGGFDFVIGNPPYVEVKNYNAGLPTMASYIKEQYPCSSKGKVDLSIPFMEKGLSILNGMGKLGFIVQKRFFKTDYGKSFRNKVRTEQLLQSIYEYEENDLFRGKITYVANIVFDLNTSSNNYFIYESTSSQAKLLPSDALIDEGWSFDNIQIGLLTNRLRKEIGELQQTFNVQVGIQVLWVNAYHIKVRKIFNGVIYGYSAIDNDIQIELGACRGLICNERFKALNPQRLLSYAIFPYSINDEGDVSAVSFSDFASKYPLAGAYLSKHKQLILNSVQIQPDRVKGLDRNEYWHVYTRKQNLDAISPKVVVPMTTFFPEASVIQEENIYCDNANVNFIQFSSKCDGMYALACIISSKVFGVIAKHNANPSSGGYAKYNKEFLKHVPFPNQIFQENSKLKRLAGKGKEIERLNAELETCSFETQNTIRQALAHIWKEVDKECYRLYGLNKEEIVLIESLDYYER